MRTTTFLIALAIISSVGFSKTIHVPDDYPAIQQAIDAAVQSDIIIVRQGTYVENIDFLGKAVIVISELGPEVTVIDGENRGILISGVWCCFRTVKTTVRSWRVLP